MASQPLTGINQQPLVFAQIRNGSSSPEVIKARIVTSSRVINIKSNMFLHLFYSKPYQRDQGYNHAVDQAYGFQVKSCPAEQVYRKGDILASGFRVLSEAYSKPGSNIRTLLILFILSDRQSIFASTPLVYVTI